MSGPHDHSEQAAGGHERGDDQERRPDLHQGQPDRPLRGSVTDLRQRLELLPPGHPSSPYQDDGSRRSPVIRLKDLELPVHSDLETNEAERHETGRPETGRPETGRRDAGSRRPTDASRQARDRQARDRSPRPAGATPASPRPTGATPAGPETDRRDTGRPDADRPQTRVQETGKEAPDRLEPTSAVDSDQPRSGRDGSWEWKGRRLTPDQCRIADQTLSRCRAAEGRTVFGTYGDAGRRPRCAASRRCSSTGS